MKYFLLGAFSSAFLLFGIALLYGYAGTVSYSGISQVIDGTAKVTPALAEHHGERRAAADRHRDGRGRPAVQGRRGAVPHVDARTSTRARPPRSPASWPRPPRSPPSARCCGCCTWCCPGMRWDWRPVMWGVAIATMIIGAVIAVTQTDVKRLLAYSSVAHAGFILAGVIATNKNGVSSVLFYLAAYSFVTLGAFAVVTLVRDGERRGDPPVALGRPRPALAAGRRGLRGLPAGLRRHPADVRLRGEVRGVQGRRAGRRDAAGHRRCDLLGDRGVLLHPGDRADVLQRAEGGRPVGGGARRR